LSQQNLPAYLQQYQAPDVGAALSANLGSAMPPHVSIGGGRFTLIDASNNEIPVPTFDPQIGVYLDCCIVDVNSVMSRIYFAGSYDPQADGVRPDCFSDNGVGPSTAASSPQAPTCAICPRAEWTKINNNGKKVPWCSQKQKVAVIVPGFPTLFLLAVPPNSHSFLREYVQMCKGNGANMVNLITRISFVPGVQGTLQFKAISYIDEPTAQLRQAAYAEKKTDMLVGRNDVARPAGQIAIAVQQPAQPVQQQPIQQAPVQQIAQQPWPPQGQQVQPQGQAGAGPFGGTGQAAPFVPPTQAAAAPQDTTSVAASPSDQPATGKRRRRTAAEMQAANGSAATGQTTQQPAGGPQAPFPHAGQTQQPTQTGMDFGIQQGQPASANPELSTMLDDFFKQA
jgi:hypothetical protein